VQFWLGVRYTGFYIPSPAQNLRIISNHKNYEVILHYSPRVIGRTLTQKYSFSFISLLMFYMKGEKKLYWNSKLLQEIINDFNPRVTYLRLLF
jgi:hypothetical protein